ncbi:multiubiquitin domain-containing protein [Novosphingobium sp.]|uniref:multiubiquitin domain-containing protein n=1 Tax=Novosphingobium sp. TaxID=1874826 RepID=UPI0038B7F8A3
MASPDKAGEGSKPATRIEVNGKEVEIADKEPTGAAIKAAAIRQGVQIQPNFVLQLELPNGTSRVIPDTEELKVHNHMSFTAIAPDDNS